MWREVFMRRERERKLRYKMAMLACLGACVGV